MKKFLSILLAMALCVSLVLTLGACNEPDDPENPDGPETTKHTYTVTVKDQNGNAIAGVSLMFTDSASVFVDKTTDAAGKASYEADAENANLGVMIVSVPAGYEKPTATSGIYHAKFTSGKDVSITVNKPTVSAISYKVTVVDQNGNAVEGVEIQICHSVCVNCELTNANGVTIKELPSSVGSTTLKVGILSVPAGYTIPAATVEGGYHATIAPGATEVTVEIIKN